MQEVWRWFGGDHSPWDAVGGIGVVLVAIALLVAMFRHALATIEMAKTVSPLADSANHLTEKSNASSQKETFPNILIGAATDREGAIIQDTLAIVNMGGGTAKDLRLLYRDDSSSCEIPLDKRVLAVKDVFPVPFDARRGEISGFKLTYRTAFGTQYALEFEWNGNVSQAFNQKLIVIS
jgi:hypothetical protein